MFSMARKNNNKQPIRQMDKEMNIQFTERIQMANKQKKFNLNK